MLKKSLLSLLVLSTFTGSFAQGISKRKLAEDCIAAMGRVKTLTYTLDKTERINGKMLDGSLQVKYRKTPFSVYIYMYKPDPGVEVLYVEGENNGNAYVNPNKKLLSFLDLDFDPYGKTLRKDERHTLFESGFEYMRGILKHALKVADQEGKFDEYFNLEDDLVFNGRNCYKVVLTYPKFGYETYTVQAGEDLVKIARKLNLPEHLILEKNKLKFYTDVKPGQQILVPNMYSKKAVFYIDKSNLLPIYQELHDETGIFEIYRYKNLIVNPNINPEEFTKKYKDYNF